MESESGNIVSIIQEKDGETVDEFFFFCLREKQQGVLYSELRKKRAYLKTILNKSKVKEEHTTNSAPWRCKEC